MKVLAEGLKVANVLPPMFICVVIGAIWAAYVGMHLLSLLQLGLPLDFRDHQAHARGKQQLVVSQALVTLLLTCYARAFLTSPGTVPDEERWQLGSREAVESPGTRELKLTGKRRYCKWCLHYKPDRCHHCRVCKTCVLRMDHHCPWIMNCVGFRNHKYFFLLVFYTVLNCLYVSATLLESVRGSLEVDMPPGNRFAMVLGLVLSVIMGSLMLVFMSFHAWLMMHGMSTIEFCEKSSVGFSHPTARRSLHDRGRYLNVCAVLGPRPLLWLLPVSPPMGDGVHWPEPGGGAERDADPEWTDRR